LAVTFPTGGGINSITAGGWNTGSIDARYLNSFKLTGARQQTDTLDDVAVTLRGNMGTAKATALGTFSTTGDVTDGSSFDVLHGSVGKFLVGGFLTGSTITVSDPLLGNVSKIQAEGWNNTNLVARSIGSLSVVGTPTSSPGSAAPASVLSNSRMLVISQAGD